MISIVRKNLTKVSNFNGSQFVKARFYSSDVKSIGFIGLGQMGYHMANNLYKKTNQPMTIFDLNSEVTTKFLEGKPNAKLASSILEVAETSDVIITMLPASQHVEKVYFDAESGLINRIKPNTLLIDSSTIAPNVSKKVHETFQKLNCTVVDAPVSGGILGAEAGTLTFMVGSSNLENFELAKAYLTLMGKNIVNCGDNGNGQVAKICNNMLLGIGMLGTSEALALGQKLGMDPKLLSSILNTSSGRCWSSEIYNPCPNVLENVPSNRDYSGGFGVSLMAKDMGLAVDAANSVKANVMLGSLGHQVYTMVSKSEGYENKDFGSVYKFLGGKAAKKE